MSEGPVPRKGRVRDRKLSSDEAHSLGPLAARAARSGAPLLPSPARGRPPSACLRRPPASPRPRRRHVAGAGGAGAAGRALGPGRRLLRQHRRARGGVLPGAGPLRHQDGAHLRGGRGGLPRHRRGGESRGACAGDRALAGFSLAGIPRRSAKEHDGLLCWGAGEGAPQRTRRASPCVGGRGRA